VRHSTAASPLPINHAIGRNAICVHFAKRGGFEIVGVYKEKASGAKTD